MIKRMSRFNQARSWFDTTVFAKVTTGHSPRTVASAFKLILLPRLVGALGLMVLSLCHTVSATNLDGTTSIPFCLIYQTSPYTSFAVSGDHSRGYVAFKDGFSVPVGGVVGIGVLMPVAGQINLNTTGQITLESDLMLASGASFAAGGGKIDGQGKAIFLSDNLTLPAATVLEFAGDTIIDGCNHELVLTSGAPGAQLYVNGPAGTTLKLRNMVLRGVRDYTGGVHAISFGTSANQTLELENVILHLGNTFTFIGGKLSIRGDVMVVGAHSFVYRAAYDCTINNDSMFAFDIFSTFNYQPSDGKDTHLVFPSVTARLLLNQATLFTPRLIGLKLTKGHLIVENTSTLGSDYPITPGSPVMFDEKLIQMGDGTNANEFTVTYLAGAHLEINATMLKNRNRS